MDSSLKLFKLSFKFLQIHQNLLQLIVILITMLLSLREHLENLVTIKLRYLSQKKVIKLQISIILLLNSDHLSLNQDRQKLRLLSFIYHSILKPSQNNNKKLLFQEINLHSILIVMINSVTKF